MPYGEAEKTGAEPDERSCGGDGQEGRSSQGEEAFGKTTDGNSQGGGAGALGRQEAGSFDYFIETEGRQFVSRIASREITGRQAAGVLALWYGVTL